MVGWIAWALRDGREKGRDGLNYLEAFEIVKSLLFLDRVISMGIKDVIILDLLDLLDLLLQLDFVEMLLSCAHDLQYLNSIMVEISRDQPLCMIVANIYRVSQMEIGVREYRTIRGPLVSDWGGPSLHLFCSVP